MSETTIAVTTSIDPASLPEKMRAHAAAKSLGITSKQLIAAFAERGLTIKSPQSGVTRDQVALLLEAEPTNSGSAGSESAAVKEIEAVAADGEAAADRAGSGSADVSNRVEVPDSADAAAGAATTYESSNVTIFTGEVGAAEERGRGGRGGRGRRRTQAVPGFSPLFLTPGESPADEAGPNAGAVKAESVREPHAREESGRGDTGSDGQGSGPAPGNGDTPEGEGGSRRRRRGRRGRGRGRGDDAATDNSQASATATAKASDSDSGASHGGESGDQPGKSEDGKSEDGESRHRRRRRRRKNSGSGGGDNGPSHDDPPNTEVHERPARRRGTAGGGDDEVRGISGSTRLEAKRLRRRPGGKDGGRRRQAILSESEFLARRESVERVMVVRERERHDGGGMLTQVGVLEDKVLVEHFVTTEAQRSMVGNVYLGRVQNVLPSMEAAFIDIGRGRNGVLYAGEVNWQAAGLGGKARRIEQALKPGDSVLVQVTKDPVGQKGARLSTQISLAGRFLVFVPDGNSTGISRKLPDTERRRLKAILKEVVPADSGVIIRTAAEGVSEEDIRRDVERLSRKWEKISAQAAKAQKGRSGQVKVLYEEPDLLVKVVRDLFNEDFSKLVVQGERSWNTVHEYVSELAPEMADRLEHYDNDAVDVFSVYRIDEQLAKALERTVWLPSGGTLVIDRTEAMTVIDVNTGKFTGSGGNLEETVTRNNLEAAEEIVRQLRLRDIGGMVVIDFIDMVLESNRDLVVRRLTEALGRDRTRHQVSEVTSLGLVQLTRKRLGTGLLEAFSSRCEHCCGRGIVLHDDPVLSSPTSDGDASSARRRGRRGRDDESGSHHGGTTNEHGDKPEKKDGPAPSGHPMIVAMKSHKSDDPETTPKEAAANAHHASTAEAESEDTAAGESAAPRTRTRRRVTRSAGAPADEVDVPRATEPVAPAPVVDPSAAANLAAEVSALAVVNKPERKRARRVTRPVQSTN